MRTKFIPENCIPFWGNRYAGQNIKYVSVYQENHSFLSLVLIPEDGSLWISDPEPGFCFRPLIGTEFDLLPKDDQANILLESFRQDNPDWKQRYENRNKAA